MPAKTARKKKVAAKGQKGRKVVSRGAAKKKSPARSTKSSKAAKAKTTKKTKTGKPAKAKKPETAKAAKSRAGTTAESKARPAKAVRGRAKPRAKAPARAVARRGNRSKAADQPTKPSRAERAARRRKLNQFRKLLMRKQQELVQAYHLSKGDTRAPNMDGTEDYIDYAVSSYDRDFMLSLTEMERVRIRLVEEALKRIDRGEFGRCLECDQEIPSKRLEVEPWARYCIRCAELEEQGLLEGRATEAEQDDEEDEDERASAADEDLEADQDEDEEEEEEVEFDAKIGADKNEPDEELV